MEVILSIMVVASTFNTFIDVRSIKQSPKRFADVLRICGELLPFPDIQFDLHLSTKIILQQFSKVDRGILFCLSQLLDMM